MKIEGLKKLTDEATRGDNWGLKAICQRPWRVICDGAEYTMASDGKALIVMKGCKRKLKVFEGGGIQLVLDYIRTPVRGTKMSMPKLKEFVGPPVWNHSDPCEDCKGTGTFCEGGNLCECEEDWHDVAGKPMPCEGCGGDGKIELMPLRVGRIGKLLFNLNLIGAALESAEDAEVLVELDEHRIVVSGKDWRVWVMSLNATYIKEPEVPALTV